MSASVNPLPLGSAVVTEIVRHPDGKLKSLIWDGREAEWLEPEPEQVSGDLEIDFPAGEPDFSLSTRELVAKLTACLEQTGIMTTAHAALTAYALLASWVPELLVDFPTLVVRGLPELLAGAMRVLSKLAYHPITIACQKPAELLSLPFEQRMTPLLDASNACKTLEHWLEGINTKGLRHSVSGRLIDPSGVRIILTQKSLAIFAAINVSAQPTQAQWDEQQVRELQAALLGYRLRSLLQLQKAALPSPPAAPELSLACRILQRCLWDDEQLAAQLADGWPTEAPLEDLNDETDDLRSLVLMTLDAATSVPNRKFFSVKELAKWATVLAAEQDSKQVITPEAFGKMLTELDFARKHTKSGKLLAMTEETKLKIEDLVQRYGIRPPRPTSAPIANAAAASAGQIA